MRKVTASAVILTALTGCNQSGVPSAQWSFEVPADDLSNGAQFTTDDASSDDVFSAAFPLGVQSETQSFLRQPSGDMMGPAFEQPSNVDTFATDLTRGLSGTAGLARSEFSSLVTTATDDTTNAFIQAAARPDPVASARRYAARGSQPALITSRVPYSVQPYSQSVYLPSSPAASPLSALGVVGVPTPSQSDLVSTQSIDTQTVDTRTIDTQTVGTQNADLQGTGLQALGMPIVPEAQVSPQTSASQISASQVSVPVVPTALPVLESAAVDVGSTATLPSSEIASNAIASSIDTDVPIGTAILRDLQRNADVQSSPVQSIPVDVSVETPERVPLTDFATGPESDLEADLEAGVDADRVPSASIAPFRPTIQPTPTLERLLSSRPVREASPMVARPRPNGETQLSRLPEEQSERNALSPQSGLPELPTTPEVTSDALTPDVSATSAPAVEAQLQSSAATLGRAARRNYSPLLASLQAQDNTVSTIYVPISEEPSLEVSASLVQSAIAALGDEASPTVSSTTQATTTPTTTVSRDNLANDVSSRLTQVERSSASSLANLFPVEKAFGPDASERFSDGYKSSKGDAAALLGIANKQRARYRQRISWR